MSKDFLDDYIVEVPFNGLKIDYHLGSYLQDLEADVKKIKKDNIEWKRKILQIENKQNSFEDKFNAAEKNKQESKKRPFL